MKPKHRRDLEQWARRGMKGVKESSVFLQLFSPTVTEATLAKEAIYVLQLGAAVLLDKPIIIVAPEGAVIPLKLRAIAASIQFYLPDDMESCALATRRALEAIGMVAH
jgi:hypothetical protein